MTAAARVDVLWQKVPVGSTLLFGDSQILLQSSVG